MHPIIEYWPYISLAARYTDDMDNDPADGSDYIEDALKEMHPGINLKANFRRLYPGIDFSYIVELPDKILIVNLGTRDNRGWSPCGAGNFAAIPFIDKTHRGFYLAGKETFKAIGPVLYRFGKPIIVVCHSRGCPRGVETARHAWEIYENRLTVIQYCPPPTYTKAGARRYESYKIPTYTVFSPDDIVATAGKIFGIRILHHVGEQFYLRDTNTSITEMIPVIGGHAYSAVSNRLEDLCTRNNDFEGARYIRKWKWVDTK